MKRPVDIHTHRLPRIPGTAIVNCYPDVFAPKEGEWYSVGIHPWYVPAAITSNVRCEMNVLSSLIGHPQVLAIGEAGLDKLADAPTAVQIEVFEYQAQLSVELWQTVSYSFGESSGGVAEVETAVTACQSLDYSWVSREAGFGARLCETWIYLSFGEKYQEESLRTVPAGRCFWRLTRVVCQLWNCTGGRPRFAAYPWIVYGRYAGKYRQSLF